MHRGWSLDVGDTVGIGIMRITTRERTGAGEPLIFFAVKNGNVSRYV